MSEEELSLQILQTDNQPLNTSLLENNPNSDIRWVLIEDHLFDISNLKHPRGQYIMKSISGKDITREIYGLKEMRFENKETNENKTLKYSHSWKTLRYITNYCIGAIDLPKLVVQDEGISREISSMSMDMQILNNQLSIFQKDNLIKFENFLCVEYVNLGQNNQILFIEKTQKQMFFLINGYWIDLLGKYFIAQQDNNTQYFYFALCLSPVYLQAKKKWLESLDNTSANMFIENNGNIEKELHDLYNKFKETESDKQTNILNLNSENLGSYQLPIIKSFKQKSLLQNKNMYFKGPLGTGLSFDDQTTHKYLFLIEDDGILPLLDFLEFLGQRSLIEFLGLKDSFDTADQNTLQHPVFQRDWFYSYTNDVEFYIYWEINENFVGASQILGIKQLQDIYMTYENQTETPPKKIIQNALVSCKMDLEHVPCIKAQLNNLEEIMNNILPENDTKRTNRFIISGSEKFVDKIMKDTKEKRSRFKIL